MQLSDLDTLLTSSPSLQALKDAAKQFPKEPRLHLALAHSLQSAGRFDEALQSTYTAIRIRPDFAPAHIHLAELLSLSGKPDKSVAALNDALRLDPNNAPAWRKIGDLFGQLGKLPDARRAFEHAVRLAPDNPESWLGLGRSFDYAGNLPQAEQHYREALRRNPSHATSLRSLAAAVGKQKRLEESRTLLLRSLELESHIDAWRNLGMVAATLRRFEESADAYRRSLDLTPNHLPAWLGLARSLRYLACLDESIAACDHAQTLAPNDPEVPGQRCMSLLLKGDLPRGFADYESRPLTKDFPGGKRRLSQPQYRGENPAGKTLILWGEQGMGDTFQFIRYVPLLIAQGARCFVEVQEEPLRPLIQNIPNLAGVLVRGQAWPPHDFQSSLMSLPLACRTTLDTIPNAVPYLVIDEPTRTRWKKILTPRDQDPRTRIGLVWTGSPKHLEDAWRSIPPETFAPLASVTAPNGIAWYSLQLQTPNQPPRLPPIPNLIDHMHHNKGFADAAALISEMDLIIGVDTSIIHLAGALAKPVWTILPERPDWRWMLTREDTPWYPTMRLFRQKTEGHWPELFTRLTAALQYHLNPNG